MNKNIPANISGLLKRKRSFKKPSPVNIAAKGVLGLILLIISSGYQPTFALPPLKPTVVLAAETEQTYKIDTQALPLAFQVPHPGYLSTPYSNFHPGIDIATGLGMPIKPIAPGKITKAEFTLWGLGLMVEVDHGHGYKSVYGHMGRIYVKKDQEVKETDFLGEVGMTGHTSGPHTHLEVFKDNKTIDPIFILPPIRVQPIAQDFEATGSAAIKIASTKRN